MICVICGWHLDEEYIYEYCLESCDYDFVICPGCDNEVELDRSEIIKIK